MVLDRSSTIAKPQSFGNMSKSCCRKKWTKMKLTFDIEFPSVEVVGQQVLDQHWPPWSTCAIRFGLKSTFHGERKGSTCSIKSRPWDKKHERNHGRHQNLSTMWLFYTNMMPRNLSIMVGRPESYSGRYCRTVDIANLPWKWGKQEAEMMVERWVRHL